MEPKHLGYSKRYSELNLFFYIHDGYSIDILQPKPLDNQDIALDEDRVFTNNKESLVMSYYKDPRQSSPCTKFLRSICAATYLLICFT